MMWEYGLVNVVLPVSLELLLLYWKEMSLVFMRRVNERLLVEA